MPDILGSLLSTTSHFRGKDRLTQLWIAYHRRRSALKKLPDEALVELDLGVPYEASVWLELDNRQDLCLIQRLLGAGDVFVDCGANVGIWTLAAAVAVGANGCVHAFEPHPRVFRKLQRNVSLSGFQDRVRIYRSAVGSRRATLPFQMEKLHDTSRIVDVPTADSIEVEVLTLDSIFEEGPVHGVKLDLEGFELEALRGATELLAREMPWLIVEFNTAVAGTHRLGDWAVHKFLTGKGYSCQTTAAAVNGEMEEVSPEWQTKLGHCNLLYEADRSACRDGKVGSASA